MVSAGNSGNKLKVISASRRIDMVGCYPDDFVNILQQKCPPETVHTLVIWTKNATNLFAHAALSRQVKQYQQLHLHYTVTGMGGSLLEPAVPKTEKALSMVPRLIELVKSPELIRFRFDPVVHFILPDGKTYCNLPLFDSIAKHISDYGITDVSVSWMSAYKKVINRLARAGIKVIDITPDQQQTEYELLLNIAQNYGLRIHCCSMPGMPRSKCIDGQLYNLRHPQKYLCSEKRAKGQRKDCGCTESWDIGWYHKCLHGCLYCYANPLERY